MKLELEHRLVEKYSFTLQEYGGDPVKTCMYWGFEHGDGWFDILDDLLNKIDHYEEQVTQVDPDYRRVVFEQVKEKFGELRIYYRGGDEKVGNLMDDAIRKAFETCEVCGKHGKLNTKGWMSVRCDECLEKVRGA